MRILDEMLEVLAEHYRMLREVALCDVVCAVCHKRRTYDRLQWKRFSRKVA